MDKTLDNADNLSKIDDMSKIDNLNKIETNVIESSDTGEATEARDVLPDYEKFAERAKQKEEIKSLTNDQIIEEVTKLQAAMKNQYAIKLKNKNFSGYVNFFRDNFNGLYLCYPHIFNMVMETGDEFEMGKLKYMLNLKAQMENGEITEKNASATVGEKMAKEYVYPVIHDK